MTAQEYYQNQPQNYGVVNTPPQYQPYGSPAPQQRRPSHSGSPYAQHASPYPYGGTPQPQPFQQPFLPPSPNQQQLQRRPPFPPPIQTQETYAQTQSHAPQVLPAHLRPTRSYSEPPSPRDYEQHRRRHASHDRRRSPSPSDSESDYSSRSRSRSRHRHHERPVHPSSRKLSWADKARGKKEYISRDGGRDHTSRNTFWGAFGGGAIGDLIAPGLGTLGGALLGGVGGHQVGRNRSGSDRDGGRSRTRKRDKYDEEWEEGQRRRGEI